MTKKLNSTEAHVLYAKVFVDAVPRSFTADAGLFDAAEWSLDWRQDSLVDANHPDLETLRHTPDLADVAGKEVTWKTKQKMFTT